MTDGDLFDDDHLLVPEGAFSVVRRGVASSEPLRKGIGVVIGLGVAVAVSRLVAPALLREAIDGVQSPDGLRTSVVIGASSIGAAVVIVASLLFYVLSRNLIRRAEAAIALLRSQAFSHVHGLSIADHNETRRGILVARVTSDANALGSFVQWGMMTWIVQPMVIVGTFVLSAVYAWQLALVTLIAYLPALPVVKSMQKRMFVSHDALRTETGSMLATFSESVAGAETIRAYGTQARSQQQLHASTESTYRANLRANRLMASVFVVGDLFGALALAAVLVTGLAFHESWGITAGELTACLFLTTLLQHPVGELGETLNETQEAAAGWRKLLVLLDRRADIDEPVDGRVLPAGPLEIDADRVTFAYRRSEPVLNDVSVRIAAGTNVAIVGESGSGKTTFTKLLARLADPAAGELRVGGVALDQVDPSSRLASIRVVPQDGFLFDISIGENIRYGRPDATDSDVAAALCAVGLDGWVDKFPSGLDTKVGERGTNLSVGERQLVALARAALANPGLLILDEATSAVDPETDLALTTAIRRLAENRTLVSVAHRLSTAEAADTILVFDAGSIAESGSHDDLIGRGGTYARLHAAWLGATTESL